MSRPRPLDEAVGLNVTNVHARSQLDGIGNDVVADLDGRTGQEVDGHPAREKRAGASAPGTHVATVNGDAASRL
jgi:hypothetical protein